MWTNGSLELGFLSDSEYFFWEPRVLWLNAFSEFFVALTCYVIISACLFYVLAILSLAIGVVFFIAFNRAAQSLCHGSDHL